MQRLGPDEQNAGAESLSSVPVHGGPFVRFRSRREFSATGQCHG
jgi:hypothetical protein